MPEFIYLIKLLSVLSCLSIKDFTFYFCLKLLSIYWKFTCAHGTHVALRSGLGLQQMGMHSENPEGCNLTHIWDRANSLSLLDGGADGRGEQMGPAGLLTPLCFPPLLVSCSPRSPCLRSAHWGMGTGETAATDAVLRTLEEWDRSENEGCVT